MIRRPPRSTRTHTLSLHDALPISRPPLTAASQQDTHTRTNTHTSCVHVLCVCVRSEEHTSELQSLMRISYAVFCLKKKTNKKVQLINSNLSQMYENHS